MWLGRFDSSVADGCAILQSERHIPLICFPEQEQAMLVMRRIETAKHEKYPAIPISPLPAVGPNDRVCVFLCHPEQSEGSHQASLDRTIID
jgi:hypothetical protein